MDDNFPKKNDVATEETREAHVAWFVTIVNHDGQMPRLGL